MLLFFLLDFVICSIFVAMYDPVRDVDTINSLCYLLKVSVETFSENRVIPGKLQ